MTRRMDNFGMRNQGFSSRSFDIQQNPQQQQPAAKPMKMPKAENVPQIAAPASPDNRSLVAELGGSLRNRADAGANQAISQAAARSGGDTSSPLFQMLSMNAKTGAAGQAGGQIADLQLQAAEAGQQRELQRQMANQQAQQQAQQIANQFALGAGQLSLGQQELAQQGDLSREKNRIDWFRSVAKPGSHVGEYMAENMGFWNPEDHYSDWNTR